MTTEEWIELAIVHTTGPGDDLKNLHRILSWLSLYYYTNAEVVQKVEQRLGLIPSLPAETDAWISGLDKPVKSFSALSAQQAKKKARRKEREEESA